jgi:hypothetical protein
VRLCIARLAYRVLPDWNWADVVNVLLSGIILSLASSRISFSHILAIVG